MTREEAKRRAELYSAVANGKTIQIQSINGEWSDVQNSTLLCIDDDRYKYRVKPEPKYRPFKTIEECWNEMHNHPDFGWVVAKNRKIMYHIDSVEWFLVINGISYTFDDMYRTYTFTDGAPFGVKEEQ